MRSTIPVLILALGGLAGCVETSGMSGGSGATVAERCQSRAVRLLKTPADNVTIANAISYPEGDLVTLDIAGQGKIQCQADVDGKLGDLVWISGGPKAEAPATPG